MPQRFLDHTLESRVVRREVGLDAQFIHALVRTGSTGQKVFDDNASPAIAVEDLADSFCRFAIYLDADL
jgi:hypothetical protein